MPKFERLSKLHKYSAAISFLAMEIFALIAFSFGSNYILYGALALALLVLLIIFNIKEITMDGMSSIALFFLPLFLFTVISALGVYMRSYAAIGTFSIAELLFIPLGLLPMSFCGYMLSIDKTFKISTFLIVIYSALGVISLINLVVNLVNFGFFYSLIYKGYIMYYGGAMSSVTVDHMAYVLQGFKFIEVKMERYLLFPTLLLTSSIALFFLSPKEERRMFFTYLAFTLVGLTCLIFVPSLDALLRVIVIGVIDALIFLLKKFTVIRKPAKIALYVILALGGLGYLAIILNNQSALGFIHNITTSNALFNRVFNSNRFVNIYNPTVKDVLCSSNFLGFVGEADAFGNVYPTPVSSNFYFDTFMTSGVLGAVAIIFAFVIGFKGFKRYFSLENDKFYIKASIISLVVFYLIYIGIFNSTDYGVFYEINEPVFISGPFMLMVFIFSYVLAKAPKVTKEEEKKEEIPQVEEVSTNE